jgi:hypothetical protein
MFAGSLAVLSHVKRDGLAEATLHQDTGESNGSIGDTGSKVSNNFILLCHYAI